MAPSRHHKTVVKQAWGTTCPVLLGALLLGPPPNHNQSYPNPNPNHNITSPGLPQKSNGFFCGPRATFHWKFDENWLSKSC